MQVADVDQDMLLDFIVVNSNLPNQIYRILAFNAAMFTIDIDSPTIIGHMTSGGRQDDTRTIKVCGPERDWIGFARPLGGAETASQPHQLDSRTAIEHAPGIHLMWSRLISIPITGIHLNADPS